MIKEYVIKWCEKDICPLVQDGHIQGGPSDWWCTVVRIEHSEEYMVRNPLGPTWHALPCAGHLYNRPAACPLKEVGRSSIDNTPYWDGMNA